MEEITSGDFKAQFYKHTLLNGLVLKLLNLTARTITYCNRQFCLFTNIGLYVHVDIIFVNDYETFKEIISLLLMYFHSIPSLFAELSCHNLLL